MEKFYNNEVVFSDKYITQIKTRMLLPIRHIDYASIVVEDKQIYCVKQTPLEIIKHSLEKDWTSYDGRRELIIKRSGFKYKTPIILRERDNILAFPTMGGKRFDCAWIFLNDLTHIHKQGKKSSVSFNCGRTIDLDISFFTLRSQLNNTKAVAKLIEEDNKVKTEGDNNNWQLF